MLAAVDIFGPDCGEGGDIGGETGWHEAREERGESEAEHRGAIGHGHDGGQGLVVAAANGQASGSSR